MRYLVPLTAAACLLAGVSGAAASADCQLTPFNFYFGTDTSTQMTVKSGKVCSSNIRYGGGGASQIAVSQSPSNGSVMTPSNTRWEYVSRRGFTGTDHFVVDVTGESMGTRVYRGTTHIAVDVNVIP